VSKPDAAERNTGISNRESAREESAERAAHPPVDTSAPPPEDAAGRAGDTPGDDPADGAQTSHKSGSHSTAQKQADSRYPDTPMPSSNKVPGAFGKEPDDSGGTAPG